MCYERDYKIFEDRKKAEDTRVVQERRAVCLRTSAHEQRVPVGWRICDLRRPCRGSRTGDVLHGHRLIPQFRELLGEGPRDEIRTTARTERLDQADRVCWIVRCEHGVRVDARSCGPFLALIHGQPLSLECRCLILSADETFEVFRAEYNH